MYNSIADQTIECSKKYKSPRERLQFLTVNLRVHYCKDVEHSVLQLTSIKNDIFCLHNNEDGIQEDAKDLADVREFKLLIDRLREDVLSE